MDDLISEFITETAESLSVLDMELVKLEQNPNDKEILGNIFRLVHTIKGTCGFLGLPRLETVAHAGENVLGKIRDDEIEVTPGAISIVLEALDRITSIMDHLEANGEEPEGSDEDLINRLNIYAQGGTPEGEGESSPSVAAEEEPAVEEVKEAKAEEKEPETEGGLSREELDALEKAFMEAEPTVEGGVDAPVASASPEKEEAKAEAKEAPEEEEKAEAKEETSAPPAKAPAAAISDTTKEKAIKQGLAANTKEAAGSSNLANQSIRVNLDVLEKLMQMVGELVLTRNQLMQIVRNRDDDDNELKAPLQHLSHITTELQEGVMKTRMQPIGNAWAKFPRLIRDLSLELSKKIELRMVGAETELDRQLLELIKDPLTHMVRNSCDHGLERPEERLEAGKPETGTVTLSAYHEGGHIIIEISDNGKGVNLEKITEKALENGITTEDELLGMTDQQIMQFIFKPGFSTAEKVTSVSGRGVGMDVVRTNIEKIGGTVELTSESGKGSTFHIKIPLTLAIVSVLIMETSNEKFAIPQINVVELVRSAADSEYKIEMISNAPVLRLRDKLLPLITLRDVLQLPKIERETALNELDMYNADEEYIVVCRVGGTDFGIIVDRIYDTEEIVVKPVSELLKDISVYSGNTILGDGTVIMILDPNGLAKMAGELESGGKNDAEHLSMAKAGSDRKVSFLLFKSGEGAPKAVPLELVSRLEEIDVKDIELSGDKPVIQYRNELMRLSTLKSEGIPQEGICEVIVFTYDNKTVGLIVDEIVDIVEAPLTVKLTSDDDAYLGSMVIDTKTTDVVDVGYLLRGMIDDISLEDLFGKRKNVEYHLMLVEDSVFFQKLTVPFLAQVGYRVTPFNTAMEALEALRENPNEYDIIVTDIEMPEMDGFAFAERLRENTAYDHMPIIAFTSTINQQFIARSQEIGINDFILKTDRERLIQSIADQLTREEKEAA